MTEELDLISGRKLGEESNIPRQDRAPFGRDWVRTEPLSPAFFRKAEDHAATLAAEPARITSLETARPRAVCLQHSPPFRPA
jgi:hypothetical protein